MVSKSFSGPKAVAFMVGAVLCAMPLEIPELTFTLLGALLYVLLNCGTLPLKLKLKADEDFKDAPRLRGLREPERSPATARPLAHARSHEALKLYPRLPFALTPSTTQLAQTIAPEPRLRRSLLTAGFDSQAVELARQIAPTDADNTIARGVACIVRELIRQKLPGADAIGIAHGRVGGSTAFGVAVPEVEIVVFASASSLLGHIQGCFSDDEEGRKLQKAAVRFCTQELVSSGAFKFRRSSFRSMEPKVTLVAPASLGVCTQSVPVDVLVNSNIPLRNAALLEACGRIDPRSRDLILFVRSWAKTRGICHASKGHLPPYAWTLLAIFFLQAGDHEKGPILPAMRSLDLEKPERMFGSPPPPADTHPSALIARSSIGSLFGGFVNFYARDAAWCKGALAVHLGKKVPSQRLPSNQMLWHDDGRFEVLPTILDPFEPRCNVAAFTCALGVERLREELARARELIALGASVDRLLEPWRPVF